MVYRQMGKLEDSIELLEKCLKLDPSNETYMKEMGCSLMFVGQHVRAITALDEALNFLPDDLSIHYWKAMCYYNLKAYDKAKESLKVVLAKKKHEDSLILLGNIMKMESNTEELIQFYKRSTEVVTENCELLTSLGLLYVKSRNFREAFESFGQALSSSFFDTAAVFAVGTVMHYHGDYDTALAKYRVAIRNCQDNARIWNNAGMCFYGKKKLIAAVTCLKRAHYLAPLEWEILYNLGLALLEIKQTASAFHFLNAALNFTTKSALLYVALAITLLQLEDNRNARQAFDRALQVDQENPIVLYNYICFMYRQNEISTAKAWEQKFADSVAAMQNPKSENPKVDARVSDVAFNPSSYSPVLSQMIHAVERIHNLLSAKQ